MRLKIKIHKKDILDVFIAFFICAGSIRDVFENITSHPASMTVILLFILLLLYFLVAGIRMRDLAKLILPIIFVFLLVFLTWILYPERHSFYETSLYNIWDLLFPTAGIYLMAVLLLEDRVENYIKVFKIVAHLMLIICAVQSLDVIINGVWTRGSIYNGEVVTIQSNYNLNWGYNMLIPCMIFLSLYTINHKKIYLAYILVGLVEILLYGSRGALLMFLAFAALLYVLYSSKKKNKRGCIVGVMVIVLVILAQFGVLQNTIANIAENLNFSSRTLDKLLSGSLLDDSNRSIIYLIVISKISENPIFGWGIYSDRYFMNTLVQGGSAYSHNIFLEMMLSFGILGLLFMICIVYYIIKALVKIKDERVRVVILICVGGCLPLMLSLTFWNQPMFWVLLALLFQLWKKKSVY